MNMVVYRLSYWNGLLEWITGLKSNSKSYSLSFDSKGAAVALVQNTYEPWRLGASASTQRRLQEAIDIIQKSRT